MILEVANCQFNGLSAEDLIGIVIIANRNLTPEVG